MAKDIRVLLDVKNVFNLWHGNQNTLHRLLNVQIVVEKNHGKLCVVNIVTVNIHLVIHTNYRMLNLEIRLEDVFLSMQMRLV
tara:strand:+ start:714 stop:959 length:246 start_codon:yes stop_codon:yes gene_type:complete